MEAFVELDREVGIEQRRPGGGSRHAFLLSLLAFFGASALYSGFRVGKRMGFKAMENGLLCEVRAEAFSRLLAGLFYILQHLDLFMRIGFAGPVYVEFAVHVPSRQVFVRRFGLQG